MSTVFLDPVQMDATAGHIGEHVNELTTLTADLETACSAAVPASIAGWLAEELRDIAVTARMIALLYSVAALDTAQRAQQIQADQSLAAAAPSLAATSPTFTGSPLVGGFAPFATSTATGGFTGSPSIVGGLVLAPSTPSPGAVEMRMASSADFAAQNAPWGASALFGNGRGSSGLPNLDIPGYSSTNRMLLSTPGRTYLGNNIYSGSGMTGAFSYVLPDPGHDR